MDRHRVVRTSRPAVELLEGRALLSALPHHPLPIKLQPALVAKPRAAAIATDPAGVAAIMTALNGGMGSEWVSLIRSQVRNLGAVIGGFISGKISSYSINGLTARTPGVQPQFVGQPYDQLLPTVAGASVFKGNVLELGAIMRGPFHDPDPSTYVFAFNRGSGSKLGPFFASRPGISPDLLVTLTVGPYGASATGQITDLRNGSVQPIDPSNIRIQGPVVRVFLKTAQLPSAGWPLQKYRFAFWTQTQPGRDITTVPSFAPDAKMIPIGMLKGVAVRR
jgi:hypothetical protein